MESVLTNWLFSTSLFCPLVRFCQRVWNSLSYLSTSQQVIQNFFSSVQNCISYLATSQQIVVQQRSKSTSLKTWCLFNHLKHIFKFVNKHFKPFSTHVILHVNSVNKSTCNLNFFDLFRIAFQISQQVNKLKCNKKLKLFFWNHDVQSTNSTI